MPATLPSRTFYLPEAFLTKHFFFSTTSIEIHHIRYNLYDMYPLLFLARPVLSSGSLENSAQNPYIPDSCIIVIGLQNRLHILCFLACLFENEINTSITRKLIQQPISMPFSIFISQLNRVLQFFHYFHNCNTGIAFL